MAGLAATPPAPPAHINLIELDNQIISPVTSQYIRDAIERSEDEGAVCLIIELDTPGGLLESTREIVKRMMNARVPVVVYVAPSGSRAGSAGVFITLAAHVAAMAPSTNIGAAHPVLTGGEDEGLKKILRPGEQDGKTTETASPMMQKIINDTVAWISGIARARGRNEAWARRAVTESVSVGEAEAVREHIVDLIAADVPDLVAKLMGRKVELPGKTVVLLTHDATVVKIPMRWTQRLLAAVVHPNIAYILMMLGILGLIFEFTHPTLGFSGVAGVICLLLALYAFQVLPVSYAALGLILLGLVLLILEIKIVSHGLLALGGIVALLLGSLLLYESPSPVIRVSLPVILSMVLTLSAIILFIVWRAVRSQELPVATGVEALVGQAAEAATDLAPEGQVYIHGEIWNAASTVPVPKGAAVRVLRVEGLSLIVTPLERSP
jgi:membrane-bound serine protease (ClpP class)